MRIRIFPLLVLLCIFNLDFTGINADVPKLLIPLQGNLNDYSPSYSSGVYMDAYTGTPIIQSSVSTFSYGTSSVFGNVLSSNNDGANYIKFNYTITKSYTKSFMINVYAAMSDYSSLLSGSDHYIFIGSSSNTISCGQGSTVEFDKWITSTSSIETNTWYHVVCVFDAYSNTNAIYINGVLDINSTIGVSVFTGSASNTVTIGWSDWINSLTGAEQATSILGMISMINIYDYAMPSTNVQQLFSMQWPLTSPPQPVGFLPLLTDLTEVVQNQDPYVFWGTGRIQFPLSSTGSGSVWPDLFGYNKLYPVNAYSTVDYSVCYWVSSLLESTYNLPNWIFGNPEYWQSRTFFGFGMFRDGTIWMSQGTMISNTGFMNSFTYQLSYKVPNYVSGQLVHVCGTFNHLSSLAYLYLNGQLVNFTALNPNFVGGSSIQLGSAGSITNGYWGQMKCVVWYDTVIQGSYVNTIYTSQTKGGCAGIMSSYPNRGDWIPKMSKHYLQDFLTQPTVSSPNYGWLLKDSSDSLGNQTLHSGLITLNGISQYVDLGATNGASTFYKDNIGAIGGPGTGDWTIGTAGWTFEIVLKRISIKTWGRILDFCLSTNVGAYSMFLAQNADLLGGAVYENGGDPNNSNNLVRTGNVGISNNVWYHVVYVVRMNPTNSMFSQTIYWNGIKSGEKITSLSFPSYYARNAYWLGKSEYGTDAYLNAYYDKFNVYSQAFNDSQINFLYTKSMFTSTLLTTPPPINLKVTQFNIGLLSGASVSGVATVNWNFVPNIGSVLITGTDTNGTIFQANTTGTSYTFSNLINGRTYVFNVKQLGDGITYNNNVYSTAVTSDSVFLGISPPNPTNVVFTQNVFGITIQYILPSYTTANIIYYDIRDPRNVVTISSLTASNYQIALSLLSNGCSYVVAIYYSGDGYHYYPVKSSTVTSTLTIPTVPSTIPITTGVTGSTTYQDNLAQLWTADDGFYGTGSTLRCYTGTVFGTVNPALYLCERWGTYTYTVPVYNQAGFYQVDFLLSEDNLSSPNQRVFNIQFGQQGTPYFSNIDLIALTGGRFRALKMSSLVYTTGSPITINFSPSKDNAKSGSVMITPVTLISTRSMTPGVIMLTTTIGYCIDLSNGAVTTNNWVILKPCTGGNNQNWLLDPSGFIRSAIDPKWCLTVYGNSSSNQQPLIIAPCTGYITDPSQVFTYDNTLKYWRVFGRCLDIYQNNVQNPASGLLAPSGVTIPYPTGVGYLELWDCGGGTSGNSGQKFSTVLSSPLASSWQTSNIGTSYIGQFFQESPTSMTIYGSGSDFNPANQLYQGQYVYQQVSGPQTLTVRVDSWTPALANAWQKLTLGIFPSLNDVNFARMWAISWAPNQGGGTMQTYALSDFQQWPTPVTPVEVWMKIQVTPTLITLSFSNNGISVPTLWITKPNTLPSNNYVISMIALSHVDGTMSGFSLTNISLQSTAITSPPLSGVSFVQNSDLSLKVNWNQLTFTTVQISYYLSTSTLSNAVNSTSTLNTFTIPSNALQPGKSYIVVVTAIGDGVFYTNSNSPFVVSDVITIGSIPVPVVDFFQSSYSIYVRFSPVQYATASITYYDMITPGTVITASTSATSPFVIPSFSLMVGRSYVVTLILVGDGYHYAPNSVTIISDTILLSLVTPLTMVTFLQKSDSTIATSWQPVINQTSSISYYNTGSPLGIRTPPGIIRYRNSGYCIEMYNGVPTTNGFVVLNTCNGSPSQNWIYDSITRSIKSATNLSWCLAVYSSASLENQALVMYGCNDADNQHFDYNSEFQQWTIFGRCLDLYNGNYNLPLSSIPSSTKQGGWGTGWPTLGFLETSTCKNLPGPSTQQFSPIVHPSGTLITGLSASQSYMIKLSNSGDAYHYSSISSVITSDPITLGLPPSVLNSKFTPQSNGTISITWSQQSNLISTITYYDLTTPTSIITAPGTIRYGNTGYCFDLYQGRTTESNYVVLNQCNGSPSQNWIYDVTKQQVRSTLISSCITVYYNVQTNGQPMVIYPCQTVAPNNQRFTYVPTTRQWNVWGRCIDLYNNNLNAVKGSVGSYTGGTGSSFEGSGFLQFFTCNEYAVSQQFSYVINPSGTLLSSLTLSRTYVVQVTNYGNNYQFSSNASSVVTSDPIKPGPIPTISNPSFGITRSFQISASWTPIAYLPMTILFYDVSKSNTLTLVSNNANSPYVFPNTLFIDGHNYVIVLQQSGDDYHYISSVSSFTNSSVFHFQNLVSFFPFQYDFQDRVNSQFAIQGSLTNPSFISNSRGRLLSWSSLGTSDQLYYTNSLFPTIVTVCVWVSNDGKNDGTPNIIIADRGTQQFGIGIWQDGTVFVGTNGITALQGATTTKTFISQQSYIIPGYITGQIVHLCVSFDSVGSTSIYVNGFLSKAGSLSAFTSSSNLNIGYLSGASSSYVGKMQCLAWWNIVFNSTQVNSLYNSQLYGDCSGIQSSYVVSPPPVYNVQVDTSQYCIISLSWYNNPSVLIYGISFMYEGSLVTLNTTQNSFVAYKLRSNTIYTFNLYQYGDGITYDNATASDVNTITITTKSGGNCGCFFIDPQQCLTNPSYLSNCHVEYPLKNTSICMPNATTQLCPSQSTSKSCASNQCMWDPYLKLCFENLFQPRSIFPCSYWTNNDMIANLACTYHGCQVRNDNLPNLVCTSDLLPSTLDFSTNFDYTVFASWSDPILTNSIPSFSSNSNVLQLNLTLPYQLKLYNGIRLPFLTVGQGSMYFQYGGVLIGTNRTISNCGSQTLYSMIQQTFPSSIFNLPMSLTHTDLMNFEIQTIRSNKSFATSNDQLSMLLKLIRGQFSVGKNSLINFISLSDDLSNITYTINVSVDQMYSNCANYGVTFNNVTSNHVASYWSFPFSYWEQRPIGSSKNFDYMDLLFTLNVQQVSNTNNIHAFIKKFPLNANITFQLKEVITSTSECPIDQGQLLSTYWISYFQIDSPALFLGPRPDSNNFFTTPSVNCYGEKVVSVAPLQIPCKRFVCVTVVKTITKCRPLISNGTSFSQCNYALTSDRIADLGGDYSYPSSLDAYHAFNLTTFLCPANRTDDLGCQVMPISMSKKLNQTSQILSAYPVVLSSYPMSVSYTMKSQAVMYGLLPNSTINRYDAIKLLDWPLIDYSNTSSINSIELNVPVYQLSRSLNLFVAMKNQNLLNSYTVSLLTTSNLSNFSIRAYKSVNSSFGFVSKSLTWLEIAPYCDYLPRNFIAKTCRVCLPLPSCNGQIGCDGLSLPLSFLSELLPSPSGMYQITFSFGVLPPAPVKLLTESQANFTALSIQENPIPYDETNWNDSDEIFVIVLTVLGALFTMVLCIALPIYLKFYT